MGLDWCLRRKPRPGCAITASKLRERIDLARQELEAVYKVVENACRIKVVKEAGELDYDYRRRLNVIVEDDEDINSLRAKLSDLEVKESECFIYPVETLATIHGAPLGVTERVLDHLLNKGMSDDGVPVPNYTRYRVFQDAGPDLTREDVRAKIGSSWDRYCVLDAYPGIKIPEDAMPRLSGMIVGEYDFRGKCIGRSDIVSEELSSRAYEDMCPSEAVDYGASLVEFADSVGAPKWEEDLAEADWDKAIIRKAGTWLIFWGEVGHGVHAWY